MRASVWGAAVRGAQVLARIRLWPLERPIIVHNGRSCGENPPTLGALQRSGAVIGVEHSDEDLGGQILRDLPLADLVIDEVVDFRRVLQMHGVRPLNVDGWSRSDDAMVSWAWCLN